MGSGFSRKKKRGQIDAESVQPASRANEQS